MAQPRGRHFAGAAAAFRTDSGGGVYSVVHRGDYRSSGRLVVTARCGQLYAGRGYAAISQPAKLFVGRLTLAAAVLSAIPITWCSCSAQHFVVNGLTAGV